MRLCRLMRPVTLSGSGKSDSASSTEVELGAGVATVTVEISGWPGPAGMFPLGARRREKGPELRYPLGEGIEVRIMASAVEVDARDF